MLNVDHLSLDSQVKINQRCNIQASLSWSPGGTQPGGAGGLRAGGRINTQPVWMHREALHGSESQEGAGQDTPSVPCRSLCPGSTGHPLDPQNRRADRSDTGNVWLQLCCCATVTTHCPLLTASSKAIIKF